MCRLVLMNKNGEKEIEKTYGLSSYLKYLEDKFGGHGNGVALLRKGKVIYLEKGVKLTVKEIANTIRKKDYDWCIFHTRLASIGSKRDSNCHPFMIGTEVMAMNGTERTEELLTKAKDITDTEAILSIKEKFNLEIPVLKNLSSIFVGFTKGKPYVVANNTRNIQLMYKKNDKSIVFASEFPDKLKKNIYDANKEFIWNGDEIDLSNFKMHKKKKQEKFKQITFSDFQEFDEIEYYQNLYEYWYKDKMTEDEFWEKLAEEGVRLNAA